MRATNRRLLFALSLCLLVGQSMCVCPDGNYESATEQCDDGNSVGGDGCSPTCTLESPSQWICTSVEGSQTSCCPALTNPITLEKVCSCAGVTQPPVSLGYFINEQCEKVDINECGTNRGNCHANANCINYDATRNCMLTYECKCPPGLFGNGITSCNTNSYQTKFKLVFEDTSIDETEVIYELKLSGVIPAGVPDENIEVVFKSAFSLSSARRRLLQEAGGGGTEATVVITSDSEEAMQEVTSTINLEVLPDTFVVSEPPTSQTTDGESFLVSTSTTGMTVQEFSYLPSSNAWKIVTKFNVDMPDTIFSPFISKYGDVADLAQNKWLTSPNNFPCLSDPTVCCLNDYKERFMVGAFADTINATIGECGPDVQGNNTNALFDPAALKYSAMQSFFADYPRSSVSMPLAGQFEFYIFNDDVVDHFGTRVDNADGSYTVNFFVGLAALNVMSAPVLSATATRVDLSIFVTPTMTFAMSSDTTYSFVEYLALSVHQNKYIDDVLALHKPQSVQLSFLLPEGMMQDMDTGLVPLTSVRYAVSTGLPDRTNASLWTNPCFSNDETGLYDNTSPLRDLYFLAGSQSCAVNLALCQNPATATLSSRLVRFNFPIGDEVITSEMEQNGQYRLYVSFDVSTATSDGSRQVTSIFAESQIKATTLSKSCEEVSSSMQLSSVVSVDLAVGMVGQDSQWDDNIAMATDIMANETFLSNGIYDLGVDHSSLATSMITLVAKGRDVLVQSRLPQDYYLQLDALQSMHFLDADKFNEVLSLIGTSDGNGGNLGYTASMNENTGYMGVSFSIDASFVCINEEDVSYSCGIRTSVSDGQIVDPNGVASLYYANHTEDNESPVKMITSNLLSNNDFSRELALNMTNIARSRYGMDGYLHTGYFINPGFNWPTSVLNGNPQGYLALSDKLIAIAIISMRSSATGEVSARRLLTVVSDGEATDIQEGAWDEVGGTAVAADELPEAAVDVETPAPQEMDVQDEDLVAVAAEVEKEIADAAFSAVKKIMDRTSRKLLATGGGTIADSVLSKLKETPIAKNLPAIQFNVDVAAVYKNMLSVPASNPTQVVDVGLKLSSSLNRTQIVTAVVESFEKSSRLICPGCSTFRVVSIVVKYLPATSRRLLQAGGIEVQAKVVLAAATEEAASWNTEQATNALTDGGLAPTEMTTEVVATTEVQDGGVVDCHAEGGNCPAGCKRYDHAEHMRNVPGGVFGTLGVALFFMWVMASMEGMGGTNDSQSTVSNYDTPAVQFFRHRP